MRIVIVGLNHKTAPVALRERLSFPGETLPERLRQLQALPSVEEGAILSTCNRVELFVAGSSPQALEAETIAWLAERVGQGELRPHLYLHHDQAAMAHGFRVASGLDSQILGEPQILGQLKQAYTQSVDAKTSGLVLNKFFHRCFHVGKRVRSETAIGENAVSISFAAVELAKKIFGDLTDHSCLLIGAGEMCELAATHLVGNGVGKVLVTNRTFTRAQELAARFAGEAFPVETLADNLHRADIVISSTGSSTFMVTAAMAKAALKKRRFRPMFFIDIAVPRDLDPDIAQVDSAFLYDIDDLDQVVAENRQGRLEAAREAEEIIAAEVVTFSRWLDSLNAVPTIVALRERLEAVRDAEVAEALRRMPGLSPSERKRVEELGRLLINKVLHHPLRRLRTSHEETGLYVEAVRKLFDLP